MTGLSQIAAVVLAVVIIVITASILVRRGAGVNPGRGGVWGSLLCAVLLTGYVIFWVSSGGPLFAIIVCAIGALCSLGLAAFLFRVGRRS